MQQQAASTGRSSSRLPETDLQLAARVHVPVLVTAGHHHERDTWARLIHANGDRARGPFVTFCGDVPRTSLATPDAAARPAEPDHDPDGVVMLRHHFEHARGGTLFIDDIAALTSMAQTHLLTLLDERLATIAAALHRTARGVRIVAGASRYLDAERAAGTFCEPLFYRLNVIHIDLIAGAASGLLEAGAERTG